MALETWNIEGWALNLANKMGIESKQNRVLLNKTYPTDMKNIVNLKTYKN